MMISIEGLLEDEQGLSMGEMLTVKIRQPSQGLDPRRPQTPKT
jgi:hypothetical protein